MENFSQKKKRPRFVGIPYNVANSDIFAKLTAYEVKFLVDLLLQYTGSNNGMLAPTHSLFKNRSWNSATLYRTFASMEHKGFVVVTRRGWKKRGKPSLVAITWNGIDEPGFKSGVKYDDGIEVSPVPLRYWCMDKSAWKHEPTHKNPDEKANKKTKDALHSVMGKPLPVPQCRSKSTNEALPVPQCRSN